MKGYIGVFDSGFGGLNILRALDRELPEYDYLYLSDTARNPYGDRSHEQVYDFTVEGIDKMFSFGCELIILACNTASAKALRRIQMDYLPKNHPHKKVLGVLIPGAEEAIDVTRNKKVGVMGTIGTVTAHTFKKEICKRDPQIEVYEQACPLLVQYVEAGECDSPAVGKALEEYLKPLTDQNVDTIILGCTHYGMLEKHIGDLVGNIALIAQGPVVARKLDEYLRIHCKTERELTKNSRRSIYTTDLSDQFIRLGSDFFGKKIAAEEVVL